MTATDGGTGEPENSAVITAHLTVGGKKIDVPMRFRGAAGKDAPPPSGYLRAPYNLWTGFWVVPDDAPTGALSYTVTATDKFGRTAEFIPYPYANSQLDESFHNPRSCPVKSESSKTTATRRAASATVRTESTARSVDWPKCDTPVIEPRSRRRRTTTDRCAR